MKRPWKDQDGKRLEKAVEVGQSRYEGTEFSHDHRRLGISRW